MADLNIGDEVTYYGYPITKEDEEEYCVKIYANDLKTAKEVIKKSLEAGVIEWPVQTAGRAKKK